MRSTTLSIALSAVLATTVSGCLTNEVTSLDQFGSVTLGSAAGWDDENKGALWFVSSVGFDLSSPHCLVLPDDVSATLNGVASNQILKGGVVSGEGRSYCGSASFYFPRLPPLNPGESPATELVITDGSSSLRMVSDDLRIPRKLTRITPVADFKPGARVRYEWQPATDTLNSLGWELDLAGGTKISGSMQIESGGYVAQLPSTPWPAGTRFYFATYSTIPASRCEGLSHCSSISDFYSDDFDVPTP